MKAKKVFMIIILIAFIGGIVVLLANVNTKSVEKQNDISNSDKNIVANDNTNISLDTNTTNKEKGGIIRKSEKKAQADTSNMIKITDNFFIEQTNDIYYNLDDYIGKTIKIEGLISYYQDANGDICYAVIRNTPGCCGNDGLAGLDIRDTEDYPEEDTWVEVIGVIGKEIVYDNTIPVIQVSSMTIKEKGTTFVTN